MPRESAFPKYFPQPNTIPEAPWPLALATAVAVGWFFWAIDLAGWFFVSAWLVALCDHTLRYWPDMRRGRVPANPMWMTETNTVIHFGIPFLLCVLLVLLQMGPMHFKSPVLWWTSLWLFELSSLISSVDWIMLLPAGVWWVLRQGLRLATHVSRSLHP